MVVDMFSRFDRLSVSSRRDRIRMVMVSCVLIERFLMDMDWFWWMKGKGCIVIFGVVCCVFCVIGVVVVWFVWLFL